MTAGIMSRSALSSDVIIMRMRRELLAARILRELASPGTTTWNPRRASLNRQLPGKTLVRCERIRWSGDVSCENCAPRVDSKGQCRKGNASNSHFDDLSCRL